jgi:23S rRNA pseudouridine2605 synthase
MESLPMQERLQKIIARAGVASRRHAEQLILSGQVRVNGRVVTELGTKADPAHDRIEAAGKLLQFPETKTYLMLHKPPQVVSTMADPEGRPTLAHLLRGLPERVFPVGRLDYAAGGLVLLTNDGELANRLLKSASRLPQTYWIKVKGRLTEEDMERLRRAAHARIRPLKSPHAPGQQAANPWYEATLGEARRDLLRKTLAVMGHPVEKMRRVKLAGIELGDLAEGRYRRLEKKEIEALEKAVSRAGAAPGGAARLRRVG